jgi:cytidine deaminase
MCRQALSEFGPDMDVVMVAADGRTRHHHLSALLPDAFGPGFLEGPPDDPPAGADGGPR